MLRILQLCPRISAMSASRFFYFFGRVFLGGLENNNLYTSNISAKQE